MADGSDEQRKAEAGLAYVCASLHDLRALFTRHPPEPPAHDSRPADPPGGDPPVLAELLHALHTPPPSGPRSGPGPEPDLYGLLDRLHAALQRAGDGTGIWGNLHDPLSSRDGRVAGANGPPVTALYLCPLGECDGRTPDPTKVTALRCAITGEPLERVHQGPGGQ